MPKGAATTAVIKVSITVPIIAGKIPPLVIPSVGSVLTKSQVSTGAPFPMISPIMIKRKMQTKPVQRSKVPHSIIDVNLFMAKELDIS